MVEKGKMIGAVMVVGGGIAGIQAALDLAEVGYFVFCLSGGRKVLYWWSYGGVR